MGAGKLHIERFDVILGGGRKSYPSFCLHKSIITFVRSLMASSIDQDIPG